MPACKGETMYPFSARSTLLLGAGLTALLSTPARAQDDTLAEPTATTAQEEQNSNSPPMPAGPIPT